MKTKKDISYSFNHTKERLRDRYGIKINGVDYTEMCEQILKKKDVKLVSEEKQKKDVQQIYNISFKGIIIRIVWSTLNKRITTALPMVG